MVAHSNPSRTLANTKPPAGGGELSQRIAGASSFCFRLFSWFHWHRRDWMVELLVSDVRARWEEVGNRFLHCRDASNTNV